MLPLGFVLPLLAATLLHVTPTAQAPSPETQAVGQAWDAAYRDPASAGFNVEPNAFLVDVVRDMTPGAALDVGMGQGRNALYLATRGWAVTGFDPSEVGVRQAREAAAKKGLTLTALVQRSQEFDWGTDRWDLIVLTYFPACGSTSRRSSRACAPEPWLSWRATTPTRRVIGHRVQVRASATGTTNCCACSPPCESSATRTCGAAPTGGCSTHGWCGCLRRNVQPRTDPQSSEGVAHRSPSRIAQTPRTRASSPSGIARRDVGPEPAVPTRHHQRVECHLAPLGVGAQLDS